jgi:hypothetical protein
MPRKSRPQLRIEMADLGLVDPFRLTIEETPPGTGQFAVRSPGGAALTVERAGLCLVGASQALFELSFRWLRQVDADAVEPASPQIGGPRMGEMRLALRRREARLLGALLRRHVARLPEAPPWMTDLEAALDEMDEFLRWQES